jgi:prepilin-type N-terminal cleavage/methylation domain-containing protein
MRRRSGFTLVELMIVVAILGVLAGAAIPAFMKYVRRSRTVEASMNLRKIFDSAVSYYGAEHAAADGAIVNRAWPGPVGVAWAPARGSCCGQPGNKCAPGNFWDTPTWQALNFSVDDPFYFSYWFSGWQFGNGDVAGETFQVAASADLDCDTRLSLYRRTGTASNDFTIAGGSALYVQDDLE